MTETILNALPTIVPFFAAGAMALAAKQGHRASLMGAATVLGISSLVAVIVGFEIRPVYNFWEEGGYSVLPPYLLSLYGVGCAVAWAHSKSPGSLRAALGCLMASPIVSFVLFRGVMNDVGLIIKNAAPEDRDIILMGTLGEAVRIVEVGGIFTVLTAVILMASTHLAPKAPISSRAS